MGGEFGFGPTPSSTGAGICFLQCVSVGTRGVVLAVMVVAPAVTIAVAVAGVVVMGGRETNQRACANGGPLLKQRERERERMSSRTLPSCNGFVGLGLQNQEKLGLTEQAQGLRVELSKDHHRPE